MPNYVFIALAVATALLNLLMSRAYCKKILEKDGDTDPQIMTWAIFTLAVGASLVSYQLSHQHHSVISNVGNAANLVQVGSIFVVLLAIGHYKKKIEFSHWICLFLSAIIILVSLATKNPLIAHGGFQAVMVLAYWPTVKKLWHTKKRTEPLRPWLISLGSMFVALLPAILKHDTLAIIYDARGIVCNLFVQWLIYRIDRKA